MSKEVYWHLPGFYINFYLHQILLDLMHEYPDKFREGYKVGSVYGTFPGAIWNGGRTVLGIANKNNIKQILDTYERLDAPVRFTWTNSCLEESHVYDTYCNLIMRLASNGKNHVLCNSEILEKYLRENYPDFEYISSTTKRIKTVEGMKEELNKGYYMVVLDYDLNHDECVINELEPYASRVEILVDEICFPNCPKRTAHYKSQSQLQLEYESAKPFDCPNIKTVPSFNVCKTRPSFISNEQIGTYIDKGYVNFKLVGRGLPEELVIDSYMYYLVKEDEVEFIKTKLLKTLNQLRLSTKR